MQKIDVCINVYGKPYQTLVTLKSLLKYSSKWIDKIFFIEESNQPDDYDFNIISNNLNYDDLIRYKPKHWLGWSHSGRLLEDILTNDIDKLYSIRYEYGLRNTDKKYLLTIHNDVLFTGDLIGHYLNNIDDDYFGIGEIGQCWNCPMLKINACNGNLLEDNINNGKYSYKDILNIFENNKPGRPQSIGFIDKTKPFPLPECRLNEWYAMINVDTYINNVIPKGNARLFGGYFSGGMDIGDVWFRDMVLLGKRFKNINSSEYARHAYFSENGNGHEADMNNLLYEKHEMYAKEFFQNNF